MRLDARAGVMPSRAIAVLSAFPWADDAAKLWPDLTLAERQRIINATRAEEEASRQYVLADDMIERAARRMGKWKR